MRAWELRSKCRPAAGVRATVSSEGVLELFSEQTSRRYQFGPTGTAIWIALRRNDDDADAAADMLSELWGTDPEDTRFRVREWIGELRQIGLVRVKH
ncbi:MAG: PqqD family peptide modification chaperone [Hamadaea sp.]|uniref:PqqD family peptide modification chaperone n=1 Tax=Hamadaea sp. TaxID=2024425 RepID=UPI0017A3D371|nr:PqqD family peptide modification chaperone [Hamadaea sp.]NUR69254.1 PqqD family peptide modification chaperone [Hamadaea sp.]NUT21116.1 PqqD family peptide modification chaperone [Hamadaea sp.]